MSSTTNLVSRDIVSVFGRSEKNLQSINNISINIASPEDIRGWSYGLVKKGETISYRTYKPEKDGLLCAKIFGPTRDYECMCGKYRRIKYKGITCEKCHVEVTSSIVRRERLGHIELASPVMHILFLRGSTSIVSTLMGTPLKDIERVINFTAYLITQPGNTTFKKNQILTPEQFEQAFNEYGPSFKAGYGPEAIKESLASMDLPLEAEIVNEQIATVKSTFKKRSLLKRLSLIKDFIASGNKPEWMVLTTLPVMPPDLRPLVLLDGGRFASSDLNELYKTVITRNDRLQRLMALKAPDIIICNEKRMLQEAVDSLLDNSKRASSTSKNSQIRTLKSLSDSLRGKQGRFRQNLLGKRVDYSARSVIVVGPTLKLHQCGLPKTMALELFKPFIFSKLMLYGKVSSVKLAQKMVENATPEVWEVLEDVVREHSVLLNRAPTLHRLSIQAFEPKLIESKAIQLHPLVCKAFNADFDGDQMAVHIPLSIEAQIEARVLMMSTNNILSPQNSQPMIVPTKDIVVGLYYITSPLYTKEEVNDSTATKTKLKVFDSYNDVLAAIDQQIIEVHTPIEYRYTYKDTKDENLKNKVFSAETTAGRIIIYNLLPNDGLVKFDDINTIFDNKMVAKVLEKVYTAYGQKHTVIFTDKITSLGFKYSTYSGLSFGKDDMIIPAEKWHHIDNTLKKIQNIEKQYAAGYITPREKYNQVTDYWSECTDKIAKDMMRGLSKDNNTKDVNSIFMMMKSGARASEMLMRQLAGMRGLIAKPSGEIIETPIVSNFKEGLRVLEYFNSAHGARKGAADTALKTADAGYLTRRLVDVAQDCVITEEDCGTSEGITYKTTFEDGKIVDKLSEILFGRTLAEDILKDGKVLIAKNTIIDENHIALLDNSTIHEAKARSTVTCNIKGGVCAKCYGYDLATRKLVNVGEAVGIIAAQSIGEPGAQLTMRTFHIGGATSKNVEKSYIEAPYDASIELVNVKTVTNRTGQEVIINNNSQIILTNSATGEKNSYTIPYSAKLYIGNKKTVKMEDRIADWDSYNTYIIAEYNGLVKLEDMVLGISYRERVDEEAGTTYKIITDWSHINKELNPRAILVDAEGNKLKSRANKEIRHFFPINAILTINDGDNIKVGDIIARIPHESTQTVKDITGGLPRVEEIFEARVPKEPAIIAEIEGIAEFSSELKTRSRLVIRNEEDPEQFVQYNIPKGKYIKVQDGSYVRKGNIIVDGDLDPHDILSVGGIENLVNYIIKEVQQVYKLQGVKIDNKHIEIIIKYMLQKVEITHAGDTNFIVGQQMDKEHFHKINEQFINSGKTPATCKAVLQGITRAAIQTNSFISAASFQETTRVLTEAAVCGKKDYLKGMKENVIVGRLIPAGTGLIMSQIRSKAKELSTNATASKIQNNKAEDK